MDNMITDSNETLYYVVLVHGQEVSPRYNSPMLAEQQIQHLSPEHQSIAEVVPVTEDGRQLLLG